MGADRKKDVRLAEARNDEGFDERSANVVPDASYRYFGGGDSKAGGGNAEWGMGGGGEGIDAARWVGNFSGITCHRLSRGGRVRSGQDGPG